MSHPTNAPENPQVPTIDELHKRNLAFVAKLEPVIERLRELVPERDEINRLRYRAYEVEEAKWTKEEWATRGEEAFGQASGWWALGDGVGKLRDLVEQIEMPPSEDEQFAAELAKRKARAGDVLGAYHTDEDEKGTRSVRTPGEGMSTDTDADALNTAEGTWKPIPAGATDEQVRQVIANSNAEMLDAEVAEVRSALVKAQYAVGDLLTTVGRAFPEDFAEEETRIRAALAEVLLTAEVAASEARGAFRRSLGEAS
ncbi:MAG: hypothetical protein M0004_12660 [Actinomycetota bacterium]|nr:hypothetical protein [Actinomycetota bacterium]